MLQAATVDRIFVSLGTYLMYYFICINKQENKNNNFCYEISLQVFE